LVEFSLDFPRAFGALTASGEFRTLAEDFQVDEELGYEPSGEGEHVYLQLRKRGENTAWVAEQIAALAQVAVNDVGYCGRKDRHAVTTQWFSIYLPKAPDIDPSFWLQLNSASINVLQASRHQHKLRRGEHQRNHFVIRLRNLETSDSNVLNKKIEQIFALGVPNYFGEQRFGRGGNNLHEAHSLLVEGRRYKDKQKRGLMLSAARSYLFNQVLDARVRGQNWLTVLDGEPMDSSSGPLWGRGRSLASGDTLAIEQGVMEPWSEWTNGLEHAGLSQERRLLRLMPENASFRWLGKDLELGFALGAGEFATAVLREIAELKTPQIEAQVDSGTAVN
jgi:tRNA pseudouridine13 synthase